MKDIVDKSARELRELIATKALSPIEVSMLSPAELKRSTLQ